MRKRKTSYFLIGLLLFQTSLFANNIISSHLDYTIYNNSKKENAINIGGYYAFYNSYTKFEFDAELTRINYKKSNTYNDNPYNKGDFTLVFSLYNQYISARIGNHMLLHYQKNDVGRHHDNIYLAGLNIHNDNIGLGFGGDYYYSDYQDFSVKQISPYICLNRFLPNTLLKTTYNHIRISKNIPNLSDNKYNNYDILLTYFFDGVSVGGSITIGKSAYKVINNGFAVHNLGDEFDNGYSVFSEFNLSDNIQLKIKYIHNKFKESKDSGDSTSNLFGVNLSYNF